jgi:fibronectin type 3 domain-containing protein
MGLRTPTGSLVGAFGAAVLLAGCGYVGEPLPPLANVPQKVTTLAAVQRGGTIIVQFLVPQVTTEDKPIPRPVKLDLRVGPSEPFNENTWATSAKQIPQVPSKDGIARYEIPSAEWNGKSVIFGVRVAAGNGKTSGWSNWVVVPVVAPPQKPTDVMATATAEGVKVTWRGQGAQFRVFRKPEGAEQFALGATVEKPEWTDPDAEFGKRISYLVQSVVKAEDKLAESDLSNEFTLTPVDKFPPAAPAGLHATVGPATVELSWDPNTENDLAGYRIYRAVGDGTFQKIADLGPIPSYSDKAVERGRKYRYAITAIDKANNESDRSAASEAVVE